MIYGTIKEILTQLQSLFHIRAQNKRALFCEHIMPLFENMLAIQQDYKKMFTDILLMQKNNLTKSELLLHVNGRRNELSDIRKYAYVNVEVLLKHLEGSVVMAYMMDTKTLKLLYDFLIYIFSYFSLPLKEDRYGTATTYLIERIKSSIHDLDMSEKVDLTEITPILNQVIDHIDFYWEKICYRYSQLKLRCV